MTQTQQQQAARKFAEEWKGHGDEKQETQRYWISLLGDVLGVVRPASCIEFEKRVRLSRMSFIDAYIPETRVLIEQKGIKIDLDRAYEQSDGTSLTPFGQAKRYAAELPFDLHPRWIVVSNFKEIRIHDMNSAEPEKCEIIRLEDLEKEFYRLEFLIDKKNENIRREEEISVEAGKLVKKLYAALIKEYSEPTAASFRSLNILCVRLVFCFYAEDAGLFATRTAFEDYIRSFPLQTVRKGLIELFRALDRTEAERDKYDETIRPFPYVNGGLFKDEDIEIPNFTEEIVDVLVNDCAAFNWSEISPTIFGAVFESTLNPETRRSGGMHYTSVENIHKVIDPLFMDALEAEFESIQKITQAKERGERLSQFHEKLGRLTFLDPACGSGNFLTEAFLCLRRLENRVIKALFGGEALLGFDELIKVKIGQFFGIEVNDFAVTVAKTALWIAESQTVAETEKIVGRQIQFLPLTTNAFIVEGNALRTDWSTLEAEDGGALAEGLFAGISSRPDGSRHHYDYIMGNPPFVGARLMSEGSEQKKDIQNIFGNIKDVQDLDYVTGWYKKAAQYIQDKRTQVCFVSTNSICQGSQVPILWNVLFNDYHVHINFAYQTFKWSSESSEQAAVHCVIVSFAGFQRNEKWLFSDGEDKKLVSNISPYLVEGDDVFVVAAKESLCGMPKMNFGNQPRDGGYFVIDEDEYKTILSKEPQLEKWLHPYIGADEFIKGKKRWCLWLKNASPKDIINSKILSEKVEAVRQFRLSSKAKTTNGYAKVPQLFAQITQPDNVDFLIVPRVSSERRRYVPIGFATSNAISSDAVQIVPNATLYHFGILTSNVHMAWMRAVCGRLEMRYRYSKEIVYNTFPWPTPTDSQKAKIEQTAQAILDARAKYSDCNFAELYGEKMYLFSELEAAHTANDRAVMQAYGFDPKMTENECVAELFKMYKKLAGEE